jgi:hypothetical protein
MRIILIVCFTAIFVFNTATAQTTFEAVDQFWSLVDKVKSNQTPTSEDWIKLFNTPGYRLYISENGVDSLSLELFKTNLVKACSNAAKAENRIENNRWLGQLERIIRLKSELDKHVRWLKSISYLDSMKVAAYKYLPERIKKSNYQNPTIYFLVFDYDGSANVKGIFMDLLLSYDLDRHKIGAFCGHELHHYILSHYQKDKKLPEIAANDKGVHWAIQVIATEGIANLVDKKYVLSSKSDYQDKEWYLATLAKGPKIITDINKNIEALAESRNEQLTKRGYWQQLLMGSGHFPGYYMAQIIEDSGLRAELVKQVDNPFHFFYLYNKAIKKSKAEAPLFSKKAISFIKELEKNYKIKG